MTTVYNLMTGEEIAAYSCEPLQALVSCFESSRGRNNTWEYAENIKAGKYPVREGTYGLSLGNFWVKK